MRVLREWNGAWDEVAEALYGQLEARREGEVDYADRDGRIVREVWQVNERAESGGGEGRDDAVRSDGVGGGG